jgi:hypothetical protein
MRALRTFAGILLLPPALLLLACGSGTTSGVDGSCDTRAANGVCTDYTGPANVIAEYKTTGCSPGTWSAGACDRTGVVGGCQQTDASTGLTYTQWEYAPVTTAVVMATCTAPAMFVAP